MSFTDTRALGEFPRGENKKRCIVTGGSGKLGRSTVEYLANEGWEVINFDTRRPITASEDGKSGIGGAYRLVEVDLTDMGQVLEAMMETDMAYKGIDAVVHLAAIPSPGQTSSSKQFGTNTMATYNILEAARKLGIRNVVLASSETLNGIPFDPEYLPIDENIERRPESAYSLSKLMGETMAEQYCRWDPKLKIISLRFSNVMLTSEYKTFAAWQDDPQLRRFNHFGYIDARDGGQAVSLALKSDKIGHHAYLIANNETVMKMPNEELVKKVWPNVQYTPTKGPNDTLLSNEKAKKELGFAPKYNWEEEAKLYP